MNQVGEVLEESSRIALSWVRAHCAALEQGLQNNAALDEDQRESSAAAASASAARHSDGSSPINWDVHLHLPAGAVQKVTLGPGVCNCLTALSSDTTVHLIDENVWLCLSCYEGVTVGHIFM